MWKGKAVVQYNTTTMGEEKNGPSTMRIALWVLAVTCVAWMQVGMRMKMRTRAAYNAVNASSSSQAGALSLSAACALECGSDDAACIRLCARTLWKDWQKISRTSREALQQRTEHEARPIDAVGKEKIADGVDAISKSTFELKMDTVEEDNDKYKDHDKDERKDKDQEEDKHERERKKTCANICLLFRYAAHTTCRTWCNAGLLLLPIHLSKRALLAHAACTRDCVRQGEPHTIASCVSECDRATSTTVSSLKSAFG